MGMMAKSVRELRRQHEFAASPERAARSRASRCSMMALCAVILPTVAAAEEQDGVAALEQLGAVVTKVPWRDGETGWAVSLDYVKHAPERWVSKLGELENVVELNLRETPTNDETLAQLAGLEALTHLRRLDLVGTEVKPKGLTELSRFEELRDLSIRSLFRDLALAPDGETGRRAIDVAPLFSCKSLEALDVSGNPFLTNGHGGLVGFEALPRLRRLRVDASNLGRTGLVRLARLPNLRELEVGHYWFGPGRLGDDDLIEFVKTRVAEQSKGRVVPLEKLVLFRNDIGDRGMTVGVSQLTGLRELDITGNPVGDEGLRAVLHLENLKTLKIIGRSYSAGALSALSQLQDLRKLVLFHTNVTDEVLREYESLSHLRVLILRSSTEITDAGVRHLVKLPHLEELNLSWSPHITDAAIPSVTKLQSLKRLDLSATYITDRGLRHIGQMRQLTELRIGTLQGAGVTREGLSELTRLQALQTLNLSGAKLSDKDLLLLQTFPRLTALDLSSTSISDAGVEHLLQMTQLRRLDVTGTKISPRGERRLLAGLPQCDPVAPDPLAWSGH